MKFCHAYCMKALPEAAARRDDTIGVLCSWRASGSFCRHWGADPWTLMNGPWALMNDPCSGPVNWGARGSGPVPRLGGRRPLPAAPREPPGRDTGTGNGAGNGTGSPDSPCHACPELVRDSPASLRFGPKSSEMTGSLPGDFQCILGQAH